MSNDEEMKSPAKDESEKEAGSASDSDGEAEASPKEATKKRKAPPKKEKKERKPREKKEKKDKGPKKPLSAYMLYSAAHRAEVKEKNKDSKPTEVMKELGAMWKKASSDEKNKFEKLSEEDKERYRADCEKTGFKPAKGTGKVKQPKKPRSAYNLYSGERQNELKSTITAFIERTKAIAAEWKTLSADDKKKYEELAVKDKDRYEKDKEDFIAAGGKLKEKAKKKKKGEGKKPAKKKQKKAHDSDGEDDDAEKSAGSDGDDD